MKENIQLSRSVNDDSDAVLRRLLSDILTGSSEKRREIADKLSARAGRRISCSMLNAFAAPSNETARFPAALIVHLCEITGDDRLQRLVMGPRLLQLVEFAERELRGYRDQKEMQEMRERLMDALAREEFAKRK
jgi:hypothetical protein